MGASHTATTESYPQCGVTRLPDDSLCKAKITQQKQKIVKISHIMRIPDDKIYSVQETKRVHSFSTPTLPWKLSKPPTAQATGVLTKRSAVRLLMQQISNLFSSSASILGLCFEDETPSSVHEIQHGSTSGKQKSFLHCIVLLEEELQNGEKNLLVNNG